MDGYGSRRYHQTNDANRSTSTAIIFDHSETETSSFTGTGAAAPLSSYSSHVARESSPPSPPRLLFLIQNFIAGLIISYALLDLSSLSSMLYTSVTFLITFASGSIALFIASSSTSSSENGIGGILSSVNYPSQIRYFHFLALATSLAWGYILGIEIVAVLGTLGVALGTTSTMVGIFLFALGSHAGG